MALPFVGCDKRKQKHARIRKSESAIRAISLPSALLRFYFSTALIKPLRRRVSPRLLYSRSGVSQLSLLERLIKSPALVCFSISLLNLSNSIVCCLTAVYSDIRRPLRGYFSQRMPFYLLHFFFTSISAGNTLVLLPTVARDYRLLTTKRSDRA